MSLTKLDLIVGKSVEEATTYIQFIGMRIRLVSVDGKAFIGTRDYRTDRVNLTVVNGVVTAVTAG